MAIKGGIPNVLVSLSLEMAVTLSGYRVASYTVDPTSGVSNCGKNHISVCRRRFYVQPCFTLVAVDLYQLMYMLVVLGSTIGNWVGDGTC